METDYDSPPRPQRTKLQNKKQYGKKARRKTVGATQQQSIEKVGEMIVRKESSESEELEKESRGIQEVRRIKEVKGKGGEGEGREIEKGKGKAENTPGDEGVATSKGKTRVRESISSQRQISSRSRKSQPVLLAPHASSSTSSQSISLHNQGVNRTQPHASTSRLPFENHDLPLPPQLNAQSSASDLESAPPIKKKRLSLTSLIPQNRAENATSQHSRTSSLDSLTTKFDKTFPPTSVQAFRASTVSPGLSAFSDKSNVPPSTSAPSSNVPKKLHSRSTTNSPRLTNFPPTLPRFTRSHSTRLSLYRPRDSPRRSTSKLSVFQDQPIASTSTSTSSSSRPSPPAPSSHSKRLSLSQFPSVSPSFVSENTLSKPRFRFTTTTFPDAPPSPTFDLGTALFESAGGTGGKEAEGAGMESTFLLESWDANATVSSQVQVGEEENHNENEKEERKREEEEEEAVEMEERKGGIEFADETNSTIRGEGEGEVSLETTVQQEETREAREEEEEAEAEEVEEAISEVSEILEMPRVEDHDQVQLDEDEQALEYEADTSDPSQSQSLSTSSPSPSPSPRLIYTASFLPPRRPRSLSHPLKLSPSSTPPKIPSDEDDLAFLIRTTATHSSEDDLPPLSSDLSSDERDFQLDEREIGRGIKMTSNQRGKRVEMREKLRVRGLKIGEGKEGRRKGWRREILDLTGENNDEDDELALPSTTRGRRVKKEEEESVES